MRIEHPHRRDVVRRIRHLDPDTDWHQIYQLTCFYDFPSETRLGFHLAFYRTFSTPRIAQLLERTGEMQRQPEKRAYDTGLVMYELIAHGYDQPRGRQMVRLLNRAHHRWEISDEDYLYVLTTFIVVPSRWIDAHGWRPLLPRERQAAVRFYGELARRMNIPNPPATYTEAEDILDGYECANLAASPAGTTMMRATQDLLSRRLPAPLRPHAHTIISTLIDDTRLCAALDLPAPHPALVAAANAVIRIRAWRHRLRPTRTTPWFVPGQAAGNVYSHGYNIEQLGPDSYPSPRKECG